MAKARVSELDVARFHRDGFTVVRGLFDSTEMRRITGWVEELQSLPETPGRQMMYFEPSQTQPATRLLNRVENFAPFHAELAALLNGEKLLGSVSALLGEPALLFKDKINFKMPGGSGFEPHQDAQAGWNDYAKLFVTAAVTVDATTLENGCLELGHWRHRLELVGDLWKPLSEEQTRGVEFVPYPMQAGDAAFFDSYLPHRSGLNRTLEARRVLYVTYNPASEGDHRTRYFADKRRSYPPDCEREPGRVYEYKV